MSAAAENIVQAAEFITDLPILPEKAVAFAKDQVDKLAHKGIVAAVDQILEVVKKLRPANGGPVTTATRVVPAHTNQVKRDGVTYDTHDGVFTTGAYTAQPKRGSTRRTTYSRPTPRTLPYRPVSQRRYTRQAPYQTRWRVVGRPSAGRRVGGLGRYRPGYRRTGGTYGRSTYGTGRRLRRYSNRRSRTYY